MVLLSVKHRENKMELLINIQETSGIIFLICFLTIHLLKDEDVSTVWKVVVLSGWFLGGAIALVITFIRIWS